MKGKRRAKLPRNLKVYVFNVGQGDHLLLELPNGKFGIIDFYYEGPYFKEPPALTYLKYLKHELRKEVSLAFICISHPHNDHIKGIDKFLAWILKEKIDVKRIWLFAGMDLDTLKARLKESFEKTKHKIVKEAFEKATTFTSRLEKLDSFVKRRKIQPFFIQNVSLIDDQVGGAIEVVSMGPLGHHVKRFEDLVLKDLGHLLYAGSQEPTADENLVSSILLMKFGKHKLLFGGDTGEKVWKECLEHYQASGNRKRHGVCNGNFIKVSHHGSKNSSSNDLWQQIIRPQAQVTISAGTGHHHPDAETITSILNVSKAKGDSTSITSTNACSKCLNSHGVRNEQILGFNLPEPYFQAEEQEALRQMAPPQRTTKRPAPPDLIAYIFRLSEKRTRIQMSRGKIVSEGPKTLCLFGNKKPRTYFPRCAFSPHATIGRAS